MTLPTNHDTPILAELVTVKDVVELVGKEPIRVEVLNKWITFTFDYCTFKLRTK